MRAGSGAAAARRGRILAVAVVAFALQAGRVLGYLPIERVQREFQARHFYRKGEYVSWPPCVCDDAPAPAFPKDGFYGESTDDPVFAAQLVQDLAAKVFENTGGALSGFIDPGFLGTAVDNPEPVPQPVDLRPVTVHNYAEQLGALEDYLRRLTHISVPVQWIGAPGFPDQQEQAQRSFSSWGGVGELDCEDLQGYLLSKYAEAEWHLYPYRAPMTCCYVLRDEDENRACTGFAVRKGRLTVDLTNHARADGTAACCIRMVAMPGGFGASVAPSGLTLSPNWQTWTTVGLSPGAVFFSEVIPGPGSGDPPRLSPQCQTESPYRTEGWEIARAMVLLEPRFETRPDSDRTCADLCCEDCGGGCVPGAVQARVGSVDVTIVLGGTENAASAGFLHLHADKPSATMASPAMLRPIVTDANLISNENGLRQVMTYESLADVQAEDAFSYSVRFYYAAQVGPLSNGVYTLPGDPDPYAVVRIENPDGPTSSNRLRVTSSLLGADQVFAYAWNEAEEAWSLETGEGPAARTQSVRTQWTLPGEEREEIWTLQGADGLVQSRRTETYRVFPWGEERILSIDDPAGRALVTTWAYFEDPVADGGAYGRLRRTVDPNGRWTEYQYDSDGRVTQIREPHLDAPAGSPGTACRLTTRAYAAVGADGLVTETLSICGTAVQQTHRLRRLGLDSVIECLDVDAGPDTTNALITTTQRNIVGARDLKPRRVLHPDGTLTTYSYNLPEGELKVDCRHGEPSADGQSVVRGTRTIESTNLRGQTVLLEKRNVETGRQIDWMKAVESDAFDRPLRIAHLDGTERTVTYGCCGIEAETDRGGVQTGYTRDALGRAKATTRNGITEMRTFDALGRVRRIARQGTDGTEIVQAGFLYDVAGLLVAETNAAGGVTTYDEEIVGPHKIRTSMYPDGGTRIEEYFLDGRLYEVRGTAVSPRRYYYGVEPVAYEGLVRPMRFTQTIALGPEPGDTNEWTKVYTDALDRPVVTLSADGARSTEHYNAKGQLARAVDPDGVTTLYAYNAEGRLEYTATDVNTNGVMDLAGPDRVTRSTYRVFYSSGFVWEENRSLAWSIDGSSSNSVETLKRLRSVDGRKTIEILSGMTNQTLVAVDPSAQARSVTQIAPDGTKETTFSTNGWPRRIARFDANGELLEEAILGYDPHGRVSTETRSGGGTEAYTWDAADRQTSVQLPPAEPGETSMVISNGYDVMGRSVWTLRPEGLVSNEYYASGQLQRTFGAGTVPVAHTYDPQGRLQTMTTWTNFLESSGAATTTWRYDLRSLLAEKEYADGSLVRYDYTPAGRLRSRSWARPGAETTYTYDGSGLLERMTYGEGTPPVTFTYDRLGRLTGVSDAAGERALVYDAAGRVTNEVFSAGAFAGWSLARRYTADQPAGLAVYAAGHRVHDVGWDHDAASRLSGVTSGALVARYAFDPTTGRASGMTGTWAGAERLRTSGRYDRLGRLTEWTNATAGGAQVLTRRGYRYEGLEKRTRMDLEDGGWWTFAYDGLGQLTNAVRHGSDGLPRAGNAFGYLYDDIGNRRETMESGHLSTYRADLLNQYQERTLPGLVHVAGEAKSSATVTVNDAPVSRDGLLFHAAMPVDNAATGVYVSLNVVAVVNDAGPEGEDAVMEEMRQVFVPGSPEVFEHDPDGNLVLDGQWNYEWDAENRLRRMTTRSGLDPTLPRRRLTFSYDYLGRRFRKQVETWDGAAWQALADHYFVYDAWMPVVECIHTASPAQAHTNTYTWGMDVSGTLHGAAGIGGLVAVSFDGSNTCFATHDGRGNILELIDAPAGEPAARYEYSPFGRLLRATGPRAHDNPFRFSTRYTDNETALVQYPYRYYNPSTGRWICRDPIEEFGGNNLYGFVGNDTVDGVDPLGWEGMYGSGVIADTVGALTRPSRFAIGHAAGVSTGDMFSSPAPDPEYDSHQCEFLITVTGIRMKEKKAQQLFMNQVSQVSTFKGIRNPCFVNNPSRWGGLGDCNQIVMHEFAYAIDLPAARTARRIRAAAKQAELNNCSCWCINIVSHSQGTMVVKRALELISRDTKHHVTAIGLGGQTTFGDGDGLLEAFNIVHVNDPVPHTWNRLSRWNGNDPVTSFGFVDPANAPPGEHDYMYRSGYDAHSWDETYIPYLRKHPLGIMRCKPVP